MPSDPVPDGVCGPVSGLDVIIVDEPNAMKRGRPTKLNPELIAAIADNVAKPMPFNYACEREGVSERLGYQWLNRGEAGEEPYDVFYSAITRARANAVAKLVDHSLQGGRGSQNAVWHLERRFREHYGDIKRIEHAGHDGQALQINVKPLHEMTDDELRAALQSAGSAVGALPPGVSPEGSPEEPAAVLLEDGPGLRSDVAPCEDHLPVSGGPVSQGD